MQTELQKNPNEQAAPLKAEEQVQVDPAAAPGGPILPPKAKLNADQLLTAYLNKPTTFLDWMGIIGLMLFTYGYTVLLLYIFTEWGANSGSNQEDLYLSCQIFNLVIFVCYVVICAVLWKIFIGRREQMKADLIQKKLKIQETL